MSKSLVNKFKKIAKKGILIGAVIASSLYSCEKDDIIKELEETDSPKIENPVYEGLYENSRIVEGETLDLLSNYDSTGISFSKEMDYSVGDIIAGGISKKTPYGFLEKIIKVSDDKKRFNTKNASLEELIEKGEINFNKILTMNDLVDGKKAQLKKSTNLDYEFSHEIDNIVIYDHDGNLSTMDDQVTASGEIIFNAGVILNAIYDNEFKDLFFRTDIEAELNLKLKAGDKNIINGIDKSKELMNFNFMTFPIPGTPVTVTPNITLTAGVIGNYSGEVGVDMSTKFNFSNELIYENSEWSNTIDKGIAFGFDDPEVSANVDIKGYIEPKLTLKIYNSIGPSASIEGYLKFHADTRENPWWNLNAGVEAKVGVDMGIFKRVFPDYNKTVWSLEKRIFESEGEKEAEGWKDDFEGYTRGNSRGWLLRVGDNGFVTLGGYSSSEICEERGKNYLGVFPGDNYISALKEVGKIDNYELSMQISLKKRSDQMNKIIYVGLREGMDVSKKYEELINIDANGNVRTDGGKLIRAANQNDDEWLYIKFKYTNKDYPKISYLINDNLIFEEERDLDSNMTSLELGSENGTAIFDNVEVRKLN